VQVLSNYSTGEQPDDRKDNNRIPNSSGSIVEFPEGSKQKLLFLLELTTKGVKIKGVKT
jgi:hypothetical protein